MALKDFIHDKPVIDTLRLRLRPITGDDVSALYEWMPDKSVYTYWGKGPSKSERNPELLFDNAVKPSKSFHLGICEKTPDRVIGDIWVYLIENDRMATVAVRLAPLYHGKGYGSEALSAMTAFCFENTELQRLHAEADVRNTASWKMLQKCGYLREGHIRQGKMVNTWCDYYIYAILKADYMKMTENK